MSFDLFVAPNAFIIAVVGMWSASIVIPLYVLSIVCAICHAYIERFITCVIARYSAPTVDRETACRLRHVYFIDIT